QALRLAPTTAVSPFYYLMLVWAIGIGFLGWGDVPTIELIIGSAIVVASGPFLLWHEARRPGKTHAALSRGAYPFSKKPVPTFPGYVLCRDGAFGGPLGLHFGHFLERDRRPEQIALCLIAAERREIALLIDRLDALRRRGHAERAGD